MKWRFILSLCRLALLLAIFDFKFLHLLTIFLQFLLTSDGLLSGLVQFVLHLFYLITQFLILPLLDHLVGILDPLSLLFVLIGIFLIFLLELSRMATLLLFDRFAIM